MRGVIKYLKPNQFGFYTLGLKVDGQEKFTFIEVGGKTPQFKGIDLAQNMIVEVRTEETQYGLKLAGLSVKGKETPGSAPKSRAKSPAPKKDDNYEAGVTAGAAINNATLLVAHGVVKLEDLPKVAERIALASVALKSKLKGSPVQPEEAVQTPPPPAHVTEPVPETAQPATEAAPNGFSTTDFADELPF